MAEDQGKQEEEKCDFTGEGEALGYVSLDQARLDAVQTARSEPGNYGRRWRNVPMVYEVVEDQETEDNYIIILSFRPEGDFTGTPGREQFVFRNKIGEIAFRQVLTVPSRRGRLPVIPAAVGLAIVGGIVAVAGVFAVGGFDGGGDDGAAVPGAPITVLAPTSAPAIEATITSTPLAAVITNPEPVGAKCLIIDAVEDTYVVTDLADDADPQGFRKQNYGGLEFLKTWYAWGVVQDERLLSIDLIKFDLGELQGLDIESISLQMFARQTNLTEAARLVDVHLVNGQWLESEVTFETRPSWDNVPVATAAIYGAGGWYIWNITGSATSAVRRGQISYAVALRSATQENEEQVLFVSKEALDKAPRMLVTYSTSPGTGIGTPVPPGTKCLNIDAVEDTYVVTDLASAEDPQGFRKQNYGSLEFLKTWYAWGMLQDERLLSVDLIKFDLRKLQGLDIESISLQMFARQTDLTEAARLVDVHLVNGQWSESQVTYETRPSWDNVPVATAAIYGAGGWYTWNTTGSATAAVRRGEISYAVALRSATQDNEEQVLFVSKEALDEGPRMLVTFDAR